MPAMSRAILVGAGLASLDAEASELMVAAAFDAAKDAGAADLLGAVDRILVPQGTWHYSDPARVVAATDRRPRRPGPASVRSA